MIRYRAVLFMTRSYIPWVCYWTFSAFQMRFAPILSLLIVTVILMTEYKERTFALMDLVMFGYSIIAICFNYLTSLKWFITGDGYFGYGVLTAMAWMSLLLHKPFGVYYLEKELIRRVKDTETAVSFSVAWSAVFLISTVIFGLVRHPVAAVISSNVFVFFGIIISLRLLYIPNHHINQQKQIRKSKDNAKW